MGKPKNELRTRLDEMGVAWVAIDESMTEYTQEGIVYRAYEVCGGLQVAIITPVTPEQAIAATVGRSCESCPEMDNPDSYISHLQSALKWHDEHVPRPTNPRNTCVVLEGEKPPEEVMFVRDEGGVTHYLPEWTCHMEVCETLTAEQVRECAKGVYFEGYGDGATHRGHGIEETDWQTIADKLNAMLGAETCEWCKDGKTFDRQTVMMTNHGWEKIRHCPNCGRKIGEEAE